MTNNELFVIALIVAVGLLLATLLVRFAVRASRRTHLSLQRIEDSLDERAVTLPNAVASLRSGLAERGAAAEHALWTLGRMDEQIDGVTLALAQRRRELDGLRARLDGARVSVERLKSVVGLIMRAIELRRTILG